ncbi:peptidoglycan-binding protein [Peterkaempfera bronchialis]|uniref:peptidoglycan-binding domain-containing protein n=1 Tax=Peterkaempfera bronchialis TaxID=2126346 RepID=UPI003C2B3AD4
MPGQHCPACGAERTGGLCSCPPDLTETAVLPHIEGPPLVRPYVHVSGEPDVATVPPPEPFSPGPAPSAPPSGAQASAPEAVPAAARGDFTLVPMEGRATAAHVPYSRAAGRQAATRRRRHRGALVAAALAVPTAAGIGLALTGSGGGSDRAAIVVPAPSASALVGAPLLSAGPTASGRPASTTRAATAVPSATLSASGTAQATGSTAPAAETSTTAAATSGAVTAAPGTSAPAAPPPDPAVSSSAGEATTSAPAVAPTPAETGPRTLSPGMSGPEVTELQQRLARAWTYHGRPSGSYDRRTEDAVAQFQSWYGVQGDPRGVYGPNTRERLERAFP